MKSFLGSAISKYDVDDYEDDEVTKAKAKTVYKPWDQIVTDEQNRRRFHGAFTGGFSAGFFNTVGSREGWKPSEFKSSAGNRADKRKQRVEDYMDEEDLKEFRAAAASGGTKRPGPLSQAAAEGFKKRREKEREATSASSSSSSSTAAAARGKEEERAAEGRDGEGEAPVAPSADLAEGLGVLKGVMEASSSVGSKILRQMGWRPGTRVCMPRARRVPRELRVALDEIRRREKEERRETMKKEETKREEGGGGSPKESRPVVKGPTMPSQAALERMRLEREVEQVEMGGGEEEEEETEEARRYRRLKERAEAMERDLERQFGLSQHRPPALSAGDPLPRPLDDDRRGLGFSAPSLRQMVDVPGSSTAVSGQRGGRAGGGMSGGRFPFLQQRGILWEEDDNESSLMMGSSAGLFGKGRGGRGKPSRDVEEDEMESSGYFSFLPAEGEEEPLSSFGQAGSSRDIMGIGAGEGPLPLPAGGRPLALTERGESANVQKLQKSKRDGVPFPPMYTSASDDTQGRVESSDVVLDVEGGGGRSRGLLRLEERLGQKSEDARAPSWFDGKHKWPESDRLASSSQREERETQTAQHLLRAQQARAATVGGGSAAVDRGRERSRLTADDRREALGEAPRVPAPPRSSPSLSASAASNAKPEVPVKSEGGDGAAAAASSSSSSSSSVAAATASTAGVSAQERNQEMLASILGGRARSFVRGEEQDMGGDRVHKPFGPDPEKQTRYEAFLWLKEREKMQGSKEGAGAASERERVDGRFGVSKKEEGGGEESGSRTKVKKEEEEAKGASGVRKRDRDIEREREAAEREREEGESSKDAKGQNDEDQTNRRIMTDHERRVGKAAAEREKLEFERVYRMFRSGAALVKAGDTNGALERDTGGAGGKRGVSGTSASTERKATRTVHHWAPDPLVCVRFGLPNPSLTEESHERKRGPQGGRGGIGPTSGLGASSSLQGSPLPATTPTAPIVIEDETDARSAWVDRSRQGAVGVAGSSRGTGGGTAALSEAFELEGGGKREDPAPPPSISRPAESLFKEIFGDENDEDE